jgi:hypothetical protein
MKRCPACKRVETDDALAFCRADELFYASGNDIMAVHVQTRPSLVLGQPQKLFSRRPVAADRAEGFYDSYDVSADEQRFVMLAKR